MEVNRPKVGVGVMILKDGKVLLGVRKGAHGADTWQFPGGHLEHLESVFDCAKREVLEESGLKITNLRHDFTANFRALAPKHYLHIGITADWESGEPMNLEPDKCESWGWYSFDSIPQPLFPMCQIAIDKYINKSSQVFFDE